MDHSELVKKYREEITLERDAYADHDAPVRGAGFAAASKRYKQAVCLYWIFEIIEIENADITPTLANNIIKAWMGRSVSRKVLLECFATAGRTASNKSSDADRVNELAEKYKRHVDADLLEAEIQMVKIRNELKGQ
jgi:hypothetical protein